MVKVLGEKLFIKERKINTQGMRFKKLKPKLTRI